MSFQLSQDIVEKLDGLQHLMDEGNVLCIQDSQKARLIAQVLNGNIHPPEAIKAWQVLAGDTLHTLLNELITQALDGRNEQRLVKSYSSEIADYRRS